MNGKPLSSPQEDHYIIPLFWQHGEDEARLRDEIRAMHGSGIKGFIVESRPFAGFLESAWWENTNILLDEAGKLGMGVWFFDDRVYPSGYGNGAAENRPEIRKLYLDERHIDVWGPVKGSSFMIDPWLNKEAGEKLFALAAAPIPGGIDVIDEKGIVPLEAVDGLLRWDIPGPGKWRIFIFVLTGEGGEGWTSKYINPLNEKAVSALIETCYEPYYERYSHLFGSVIRGFFTDEPRFGNASSYDAMMGNPPPDEKYYSQQRQKMVLPWSDELERELASRAGGNLKRLLPLLFYPSVDGSKELAYAYLDAASRLFGELFVRRIGDWCRERGVELIGHTVEDNGAHARLGYGTGHFYRSMAALDAAGLDVVYQIWPGVKDGRMASPFGYLDANFFYWGITKMAASEAQLDPKKKGRTVCEIFGAYGWQEGLRLMKWLTDHVAVRGVNVLIPHAFSPKDFPDPDCPPHFHAQGKNPQWKYFPRWAAYANRVCARLSGGVHVTRIGVLYHAEQEWLGDYMPFNRVVEALQTRGVDCRIIPADYLSTAEAASGGSSGGFVINGHCYGALVVPWAERMHSGILARLGELARNTEVVFAGALPAGDEKQRSAAAALTGNCRVLPLGEIAGHLAAKGFTDIAFDPPHPDLRSYHYKTGDGERFFFVNESPRERVKTTIALPANDPRISGAAYGYDAMEDRRFPAAIEGGLFNLELEPWGSVFLEFPGEAVSPESLGEPPAALTPLPSLREKYPRIINPAPLFRLSLKSYDAGEFAAPLEGRELRDIALEYPRFSGTMRYEFELESPEAVDDFILDLGEVYESAEAWVNGVSLGVRICPPYRFRGNALRRGKNLIAVEAVNTLAKALGSLNIFDRAMAQEPSGLLGPVCIRAGA
ncbi:MAG: hypothetical protein LBG84_02450 [Treponema sp.]|jgi:hypothetical protein|nr:hypothetical protein [Treponema sp.]